MDFCRLCTGACIDDKDLDWLINLRFLGVDDELVPLNVEKLDPASNHLPSIKMVRPEENARSETPEQAITQLSFDIIEQTRYVVREVQPTFLALPHSPTRSCGSHDSLATSTPFVGCPRESRLHGRSPLSRPSTGSLEPLLCSSITREIRSCMLTGRSSLPSSKQQSKLSSLSSVPVESARPQTSSSHSWSRCNTRLFSTSGCRRTPQVSPPQLSLDIESCVLSSVPCLDPFFFCPAELDCSA
jgi:hypothetical protein